MTPGNRNAQVPGIGKVTLIPITFGMIRKTEESLRAVEPEDKAEYFVARVLSEMVRSPAIKPEAVLELQNDAFVGLLELAVDNLGVREEFEELPSEMELHDRLYEAHRNQWKQAGERLGKSIAAAQRNLIAPFENSLSKLALGMETSSAVQKAVEALVPFQNSLSQMAALKATISLPLAHTDLLSSSIEPVKSALESFGPEPGLTAMMEAISRSIPPEPLLSSAMSISELNSPLIHSPSFPPTTIEALPPIEGWEESTKDAIQERLAAAYDTLSLLERGLREMIEDRMSVAYGSEWWKTKVPADVREECDGRKLEKESSFGPRFHAIHYAYVGDYLKIISRKDNWKAIFEDVFGNRTELEASFLWIGRARGSIAHARPLDDDDYLMFVAGAHWIKIRMRRN